MDANRVVDMAVWVLIAGLVGAKLLLVVVDWSHFSDNPGELLSIFKSGGVFYGGLMGGILVAWWYARRYDLPVLTKADNLSKTKQAKQRAAVARTLARDAGDLILFSAKSRRGRADVWQAIDQLLNPNPGHSA